MDTSGEHTADANDPPQTSRRIYRDTQNEMIGGVAAGFARYFGVDVVWVRLGFVLATVFANGLGIIVYVAGWIIIPEAPKGAAAVLPPPPTRPDRSVRYWLGVGLVAVGAGLLINQIAGPFLRVLGLTWIGELFFPALLIGVGVFVWKASLKERPARVSADMPSTPTDGPATDGPHTDTSVEGRVERFAKTVEHGITEIAHTVEAAVDAHYAGRPRTRTAQVTFAFALMTFGVMWLLSSVGVTFVTVPRILAATLLVIGVGSFVGAFRGRGRGLIPVGIVLSVVVLLVSATTVFPDGTRDAFFGSGPGIVYAEDVTVAPESLAALEPSYTFNNGQVTLDLRGLDRDDLAAAGVTDLTITFGVGDLTVRLPDGVGVDVSIDLGLGVIEVGDTRVTGWQSTHNFTDTLRGEDMSDGLLRLTIKQGIGRVEVGR